MRRIRQDSIYRQSPRTRTKFVGGVFAAVMVEAMAELTAPIIDAEPNQISA
jgi:hypothetical protein